MMADYIFHDVNAFTQKGEPVLGNPAAICVVRDFPAEDAMGRMAAMLGRPMTSFVRRTDDPLVFDIRHFSPDGKENHVCGHATLAAAEFLARENPALRQGAEIVFRLNPRYGITADNSFRAVIRGDDISLIMPALTDMRRVDDPEFYRRLAAALRIDEADIVKPAYYAPRIINYVVEIRDAPVFLAMAPDFEKLKTLAASAEFPHEGIMATVTAPEGQGFDIMTRVFLPIIGVDEDVACGSANCSVVPYWAAMRPGVFPDGKTDFAAIFPYPPRLEEGVVGGVQFLHIDDAAHEIVLTSQATYQKAIVITLCPAPGPDAPAP